MPNDNYCKFEDWLMPILEKMVDEQETQVGDTKGTQRGMCVHGGAQCAASHRAQSGPRQG